MSIKIQPLEFFNILYKNCKEGKLEIYYPDFNEHRIFPISNLKEKSLFFPRDREVNFRVIACDAKGRIDGNTAQVPAVWLEIDPNKTAKEEIKQKMENFKFKPSLAVISKNIRQYYWVLNVPLKLDQIEKLKDVLNKFATYFGGTIDLSVLDRFMRAPDQLSQAFKGEPVYYDLSQLEAAIPNSGPVNSESNEIPNPLEESVGIMEEDLGWD